MNRNVKTDGQRRRRTEVQRNRRAKRQKYQGAEGIGKEKCKDRWKGIQEQNFRKYVKLELELICYWSFEILPAQKTHQRYNQLFNVNCPFFAVNRLYFLSTSTGFFLSLHSSSSFFHFLLNIPVELCFTTPVILALASK